MLWKVQDLGIVNQYFDVLFRFAILSPAYLTLIETEPAAQEFLIECLTINLPMARMVAVCLENLPHISAFEGRPELVGLEELVSELSRRRAELVAFLAVTSAA
jgi:hypothetical protein